MRAERRSAVDVRAAGGGHLSGRPWQGQEGGGRPPRAARRGSVAWTRGEPPVQPPDLPPQGGRNRSPKSQQMEEALRRSHRLSIGALAVPHGEPLREGVARGCQRPRWAEVGWAQREVAEKMGNSLHQGPDLSLDLLPQKSQLRGGMLLERKVNPHCEVPLLFPLCGKAKDRSKATPRAPSPALPSSGASGRLGKWGAGPLPAPGTGPLGPPGRWAPPAEQDRKQMHPPRSP